MNLPFLPQEVILEILSHLRPADVESLAQTFSTRLYSLCLPLVTKRIAARTNANRMVERFRELFFRSKLSDLDDEVAMLLGFTSEEDINVRDEAPNLEYLDLDGDLSFLEEVPGVAVSMAPHRRGPAAIDLGHVDRLVSEAEKLGLTLPDGFVKFMSDEDLQTRIPSARAAFFTLGDGFRKCPAAVDGGEDGYLIRILADQQWCSTWSLYLCSGELGGHCILNGSSDVNMGAEETAEELVKYGTATKEEVCEAEEAGFPLASISVGNVALVGTGFEEFLATTYYEELMWYVANVENFEMTEGLRQYLKHNYTK